MSASRKRNLRFMPVIAAKQFLHRDGPAEPPVDGPDDASEPTPRVLADLLVTIWIVYGK